MSLVKLRKPIANTLLTFLHCTIAAKLLKMTLYIVKHSNKTVLMAAQLKSISVLLLMH